MAAATDRCPFLSSGTTKVVRAFLVRFLFAINNDEVRFDAAIGGEHDPALPPSMRGLNSLGEVYFAVGHGRSSLILVSV